MTSFQRPISVSHAVRHTERGGAALREILKAVESPVPLRLFTIQALTPTPASRFKPSAIRATSPRAYSASPVTPATVHTAGAE